MKRSKLTNQIKKTSCITTLAAMMFLVFSCQQNIPKADYVEPNDLGLLDSSLCSAPCWQGIMPGQTRLDDTMHILESNTFVESYHEEESNGEVKLVTWKSTTGGINSISFCGDKVLSLHFQITYPFYLSDLGVANMVG